MLWFDSSLFTLSRVGMLPLDLMERMVPMELVWSFSREPRTSRSLPSRFSADPGTRPWGEKHRLRQVGPTSEQNFKFWSHIDLVGVKTKFGLTLNACKNLGWIRVCGTRLFLVLTRFLGQNIWLLLLLPLYTVKKDTLLCWIPNDKKHSPTICGRTTQLASLEPDIKFQFMESINLNFQKRQLKESRESKKQRL